MFGWILRHRTYTLILILVLSWLLYIGYVNVWEPAAIAADAKTAAGQSVNFLKELLEFVAQKDVLDMLKTLLPILIPVFLYKKKHLIDNNVRQTTNKVVRGKIGIGDRRKTKENPQIKKRRDDTRTRIIKK